MHDHIHHHGWTIFGSVGSATSGLYAMVVQAPGSSWMAVLGVCGSIGVPIVVEAIRARGSRTVAERDATIQRLREEREELFDRLTHALANKGV